MKNNIKNYMSFGAVIAGSAFMVSCDDGDTVIAADNTDVQPADLSTEVPADLSNFQINNLTDFGGDFPYALVSGTFLNDTQLADAAAGDFQFDTAVKSANVLTLNNIYNVATAGNSAPDQDDIDAGIADSGRPQDAGDGDVIPDTKEESNPITQNVDITEFSEVDTSEDLGYLVNRYNTNMDLVRDARQLLNGTGALGSLELVPQGEVDEANEIGIDSGRSASRTSSSSSFSYIEAYDADGDHDSIPVADFNDAGVLIDDLYNNSDFTDVFGEFDGSGGRGFVGYNVLVELINQENGVLTGDLGDKIVAAKSNLDAFIATIEAENVLIKERIDSLILPELGPAGADILIISNATAVFTISNAFANDEDFVHEFNYTATASATGAEAFILSSDEDSGFKVSDVRVKPSTKVFSLESIGTGELQKDN